MRNPELKPGYFKAACEYDLENHKNILRIEKIINEQLFVVESIIPHRDYSSKHVTTEEMMDFFCDNFNPMMAAFEVEYEKNRKQSWLEQKIEKINSIFNKLKNVTKR